MASKITCFTFAYLLEKSAMTDFVEGDKIVFVKILMLPPLVAISAKLAFTSLSAASQLASTPLTTGFFNLAVSYKSKTAACACASVPPLEIGSFGLPSILIGRPSLVLTKTPNPL